MRQRQRSVAQSIRVELQAGKSEGVAPQAVGDEVQRVLEVAALGLKMMRPQIHTFRPDGFGERSHSVQPACGSRMINSICGLEISEGTCAAKLRARVTVSHAAPD